MEAVSGGPHRSGSATHSKKTVPLFTGVELFCAATNGVRRGAGDERTNRGPTACRLGLFGLSIAKVTPQDWYGTF